jgi:hypothetical protein
MHCAGVDTKLDEPRTPFGPSLILTEGMPSLSILFVFHQLGAESKIIRSSFVSLLRSSGMDAVRKSGGDIARLFLIALVVDFVT